MALFPRGYPRGRGAMRRILGRRLPVPASMFIGSGEETQGDETYSTFVANDATPALDTPDTLTFTLKDANDDPIAGAAVTYA